MSDFSSANFIYFPPTLASCVVSGYADSERGAAEARDADGSGLAGAYEPSDSHQETTLTRDSRVSWRDVNFNFAASPEDIATQRIGLGDFWDD